jgi:hypothetical protein
MDPVPLNAAKGLHGDGIAAPESSPTAGSAGTAPISVKRPIIDTMLVIDPILEGSSLSVGLVLIVRGCLESRLDFMLSETMTF